MCVCVFISIGAESLSCAMNAWNVLWPRHFYECVIFFMRITCSGNTVSHTFYNENFCLPQLWPVFQLNWIYSLCYVYFSKWLCSLSESWHLLHARCCTTLYIVYYSVGNGLECTILDKNKPSTIWSIKVTSSKSQWKKTT